MEYSIKINKDNKIAFNNNVDFCVGTGRMGLALTKEYFDQLQIVQENIGFKFIRGHGLFCDDMGIYQGFLDKTGLKAPSEFGNYEEYIDYVEANAKKIVEYNFTYLDRVVDSYLQLNIRPFLELGFMPYKMASGKNTVFYWKGNTTPPADYNKWCNMIQATLRHLIERYGKDEVLSWPIEVWNEPNLPGFWKDADIDEYFKLYELSVKAIKNVDSSFMVGGPAICGGADEKWMKGFLTYCHNNKLDLDFISRHHYCTELPEDVGHYGYPKLMDLDYTLKTLADCRKIIDSFDEYKNLPFYITEFNTSYIPNCPVHDTNLNAAYIARTLSEIGDYATGYSYWTFGDVFEERGIPFTPFHGGFGLLANGGIPKPTFWTFKFFKDLQLDFDYCVYRDKNIVIVKTKQGSYKGIAWNLSVETMTSQIDFNLNFPAAENNFVDKTDRRIFFLTKTVDEECCNPQKVWHDLGQFAHPSKTQNDLLKASANPLVKTEILKNQGNNLDVNLSVKKHGVVYFELDSAVVENDRGFNYEFDYGRNS